MSYEAENCRTHGGISKPSRCFVCQDSAEGIAPKRKLNGICRTGCETQDHADYGECLFAARINIDNTSLKS